MRRGGPLIAHFLLALYLRIHPLLSLMGLIDLIHFFLLFLLFDLVNNRLHELHILKFFPLNPQLSPKPLLTPFHDLPISLLAL